MQTRFQGVKNVIPQKAPKSEITENLDWLLNMLGNFQQADLDSNIMKQVQGDQRTAIESTEELLCGQIYTYGHVEKAFTKREFTLIPNMLLLKHNGQTFYLLLSGCTIEKSVVNYKESQSFGTILVNNTGKLFLFFGQFATNREWYKKLKQFCRLGNFLQKFKLQEQIMPRFYIGMQKKDKTLYTVALIPKRELTLSADLNDAVYNEIHLLRSVRHQSLLELKAVYEDNKFIYEVFEYFKGESLYSLVESGLVLDEVQMASLIYQILQLIKFLQQHQFHHGNISPLSCILNTNHSMLQVILINSAFKEYKADDTNQWLSERNVSAFIAPEVREGVQPSILGDLYSVGALIYYLAFRQNSRLQCSDEIEHFMKSMHTFKVDQALLEEAPQLIPKKPKNQMLFSVSQIDLMKRLLVEAPHQRMSIEETLKHHWFINVKSKLKSNKVERKRKKPLPSLRTIIELREQSEMEIRIGTILINNNGLQQKRQHMPRPSIIFNQPTTSRNLDNDDEGIVDENAEVFTLMQSLQFDQEEKCPSKSKHDKSKRFQNYRTMVLDEDKTSSFSKSKTFSASHSMGQV